MPRKRIFAKNLELTYRYVLNKIVQYHKKSSIFNSNPQTFIVCLIHAGTALGAGKTETNNLWTCPKVPSRWGRGGGYSHL